MSISSNFASKYLRIQKSQKSDFCFTLILNISSLRPYITVKVLTKFDFSQILYFFLNFYILDHCAPGLQSMAVSNKISGVQEQNFKCASVQFDLSVHFKCAYEILNLYLKEIVTIYSISKGFFVPYPAETVWA